LIIACHPVLSQLRKIARQLSGIWPELFDNPPQRHCEIIRLQPA
jgi:hypothetical protein